MSSGSPDYTQLVKRLGEILAAWIIVLVCFVVVSGLVGATNMVRGIGAAILIVVMFVAVVWVAVAWTRQSKRSAGPGREPPDIPGPQDQTGPRSLGVGGRLLLGVSLLLMLGLPLAILGALDHISGLLIAGVALLALDLLNVAAVWPLYRARSGRSR